jgi:hypothetical protein
MFEDPDSSVSVFFVVVVVSSPSLRIMPIVDRLGCWCSLFLSNTAIVLGLFSGCIPCPCFWRYFVICDLAPIITSKSYLIDVPCDSSFCDASSSESYNS